MIKIFKNKGKRVYLLRNGFTLDRMFSCPKFLLTPIKFLPAPINTFALWFLKCIYRVYVEKYRVLEEKRPSVCYLLFGPNQIMSAPIALNKL